MASSESTPRGRVRAAVSRCFTSKAVWILTREMTVNAVARYGGVTDKGTWRVVMHCVFKAMRQLDLSRLCGIGLAETAIKRGHHYVTIFVGINREILRRWDALLSNAQLEEPNRIF